MLHRSVTLTRRFVCVRPKRSTSGGGRGMIVGHRVLVVGGSLLAIGLKSGRVQEFICSRRSAALCLYIRRRRPNLASALRNLGKIGIDIGPALAINIASFGRLCGLFKVCLQPGRYLLCRRLRLEVRAACVEFPAGAMARGGRSFVSESSCRNDTRPDTSRQTRASARRGPLANG